MHGHLCAAQHEHKARGWCPSCGGGRAYSRCKAPSTRAWHALCTSLLTHGPLVAPSPTPPANSLRRASVHGSPRAAQHCMGRQCGRDLCPGLLRVSRHRGSGRMPATSAAAARPAAAAARPAAAAALPAAAAAHPAPALAAPASAAHTPAPQATICPSCKWQIARESLPWHSKGLSSLKQQSPRKSPKSVLLAQW